MNEKFKLRTEFLYSIEGALYEYTSTETGNIFRESYDFTFSYIRIPFFLKYYPFKNLNVFAGPYMDYMLYANLKLVESQVSKDLLNTDINKAFTEFHYGISGGIGYDFDKRVSLNLRYTYGFNSTVDSTDFSFEDAQQSIFTLSVGFH